MKLSPIALLFLAGTAFAGSATWNLNPTNGSWNTATNWTPATIPNGPSDTATFAVSNTTAVSIAADTEVKGVTFSSGASAFTIKAAPGFTLTIDDDGVINDSGIGQNFEAATKASGTIDIVGRINFTGNANAGASNVYSQDASAVAGQGGAPTSFFDNSSAGNSTFINKADNAGAGGALNFFDTSSAADGTFINEPASSTGIVGGLIAFFQNSTAGNGVFITQAASNLGGASGGVSFGDSASADHGIFTFEGDSIANNTLFANFQIGSFCTMASATFIFGGGTVPNAFGAQASIGGMATCDQASFTFNGGTAPGATGGVLFMEAGTTSFPSCGNATFIINGGSNGGGGGAVYLQNQQRSPAPDGGTARIELFGNGTLDLSQLFKPFITGSLEGNGIVLLGSDNLTIGTRNTSTVFSGLIQDGGFAGGTQGSFTKIGTGTLTLTGANTYTGGTAVNAGTLLVKNRQGSATGTGAVSVGAATVGGRGIIAGAVTLGSFGASSFLAPAGGTSRQATLTIQGSLTLQASATYTYTFKARNSHIRADQVIANGVTINSATIDLQGTIQGTLATGTVLTLISNTSANPIAGTFNNLADGATVTIGNNNFQASYEGGDGNDLTLTVVP
jgi:autotransporter-associated beta strand protein